MLGEAASGRLWGIEPTLEPDKDRTNVFVCILRFLSARLARM